jgi:hypothetical protein
LNLKCDILVSKFACKVDLYRYSVGGGSGGAVAAAKARAEKDKAAAAAAAADDSMVGGLYKLNPFYP